MQDIFTWLQCYRMFVSVLAPQYPERIPELMAYQATIVRASQDYAGLAWVRYDSTFRRQAALIGLTRWSVINPTLYTLCFAGSELCFATTHSTKECAQQGDPNPGVRNRLRAIEKAVLSMMPRAAPPSAPTPRTGDQQCAPSGQVCRNWNANRCNFPYYQHSHVCSSCRGRHPVGACPYRVTGKQHPQQQGTTAPAPKYPSGRASRPFKRQAPGAQLIYMVQGLA